MLLGAARRCGRVTTLPWRASTAAPLQCRLLSLTPPSRQLLATRRPRVAAAAAAAVCCGGGAGLARLLLARRGEAQCDTPPERPASQLVRSVATISEDEGRFRTVTKILWRCLELLCLLAPVLATLPLLRSRLRARWLRLLVATLERCGPVGIKWGQWASTRYDIFEDDLCDALGALTNAAPVHSIEWSRQVFRDEIGRELEEVFDGFSEQPIASGSIGQVHTAYLKVAHGPQPAGAKVAIKIQHPGLAERLGIDMAILMKGADLLGSFKGLQINDTVAQFASNFYMQLDFRDEAENLRRFHRHFASGFWRAIVSFPTPLDDLVSQHVVVETFEKGESVAEYLHKAGDSPKVTQWQRDGDRWVPVDPRQSLDAAFGGKDGSGGARDGDDIELRKKVALCGVQSYLKMLMVDNFIHADLHPGNVLVRMEDTDWIARIQRYLIIGQTGARVPHIVFLDAGLAAKFDTRIYSNVQGFFESIIKFDGPKFGQAILGLAPVQPYVESPSAFVDEVALKMEQMHQEMEDGKGRAGDNIRSFMASVRAHHVKLDPTVMVALMSMLVLEGWQFRLDPSTSIVQCIEQQLDRRSSMVGWLLSIAGRFS